MRRFNIVLGARSRAIIGCVLAIFLAAAGGCSSLADDAREMPSPSDPARTFVEQLLPNLDAELRQQAEAVATAEALQKYVTAENARSWNARLAGGIKYANRFVHLYPAREFHKAFAQSDGLTPRGQAVLDVLLEAEHHALKPSDYHVERIQNLDARLTRLSADDPHWQPVSLSGEEANHLVGWMHTHQLDPADPATQSRILSALVGATVPVVDAPAPAKKAAANAKTDTDTDTPAPKPLLPSPAPRITQRMGAFLDAFDKSAELTAELELRLADGALRYARDMRHFNLVRKDWRDFKAAGGSNAIIYARLEKTFAELSEASGEEARRLLAALEPSHPQYQKLLDARARYQAIAAQGGWKRVRKTSLTPGATSPRVGALRARLAAEGFLPRAELEAPNTVDQALLDAVKEYQITHQFRGDADPTNGFWRSLNVPVDRRIKQIELSIQRWRESQYEGEANYIMVNIPDFHAEVFQDHTRVMRFRVVTGNNKRVCDPETEKWTYPHATPVMMAELDHVILNPYWYVPQSIITHELEPKMSRDPDYLEKNGYEIVKMNGREVIRQVPGPDNALGTVKFIFPNAGNIYMHDTPSKRYFDYPVRAFSHGCVRVHEPQKLAHFLLGQDPQGKKHDVDAIFESGKQKYIELEEKLPVFIEYKTVQVDDQGRPNFLADIYRRDQLRLIEDPEEREEYLNCRTKRRPAAPAWEADAPTERPEGVESDIGP